jgi:hypothetical protein
MVDSYTKMKPDSFRLQLQAVLPTYFEDIKGVQGVSCWHKTRIVKPLFEDQDSEDDTSNEEVDTAHTVAGASAVVLPGATPAPAQRAAAAGRSLQLLHLPPTLTGRLGHWSLRGRLPRLMPIKLVRLKLKRRDTWQQPDPAYRPASRAIKKAGPKGYISVRTLFNNICTLHEMYVAICTQHISCTYLDIHVCKPSANLGAIISDYIFWALLYVLKHY